MTKEVDPLFIDTDIVLGVNALQFTDGKHRLLDRRLLESALAAPQNVWLYDDEADLFDVATSYCFHIAMNHPFQDGNKRASIATAYRFLALNELDPTARSLCPPELRVPDERIAEDVVDLVTKTITASNFSRQLFLATIPHYIRELGSSREIDLMEWGASLGIHPRRYVEFESLLTKIREGQTPADYRRLLGGVSK